ncbi:MAG: hypothetical protein M1830_003105 [Pleopsidium flavum]|nr:MAG: hypothetical protein M1830_003105 [Pleopsidium flavum]
MIGVAGGCGSPNDGTPLSTSPRWSNSNLGIASLPPKAPDILVKNTIYVKDNHKILALHEIEQRRIFQSLVKRYIAQLLYGCQERYCITPTCLSYRRRVTDAPLRKFTALSARTVACYLASDDDPEKGLCPHEPARSPGMQAITDKLVQNRDGNHNASNGSLIKEQTNNSASQSSHTTSDVAPETADRGTKASGDEPSSRGAGPRQSSDGERTPGKATEQNREKDPKSFTQNLFDTLAVRMLEWLPVPSVLNMPNFTLGGEEDRSHLAFQHPDKTKSGPRNLEHSITTEVPKLGEANALDSKLKPRSRSLTTQLRLKSASVAHQSSSQGARRPSNQRESVSNDELRQGSEQQSQHEILPRQQTIRQQALQSKMPIQAEKIDAINFPAGILNTNSGIPESVKLLDMESRRLPTRKPNGYLHDGLIDAIIKPGQTKILSESHSSGSSSPGMPLNASLHGKGDAKKISAVSPNTNHPSFGQTKALLKPWIGSSANRPPQSLSHLSLDIAKALVDVVKSSDDDIVENARLLPDLSGLRSDQILKNSILRHRRRTVQFDAQSIFYIMSTPEALLRSFRGPPQDTSPSRDGDPPISSSHPTHIDQAFRLLKTFDESRLIFRSLWISLGALFIPPPDLSHPKSPRLKAAMSISKTRSPWSSGEFGPVFPPTSNDYLSDRKAVHIMRLALSALAAAVPKVSAETMLAVRKLRASGRVAPDAHLLATNADLAKPLLEVTDVLEDELALRLMSRLVRAIAARCCAAEIVKNKQMRKYSNGGQQSCPVDVLKLLREYLREAQHDASRPSAAHNPTGSVTEANASYALSGGWSMPAITVEWLRSVLLKEWDGRAEVARWDIVGGAVMILASLYEQYEQLSLSPEFFHTPLLAERLDPIEMPVEWLASTSTNKTLSLLSYSFLFPPAALVTYFRAVNYSSMSKAYESSMTTSRLVLHLAFAGNQSESRLCNRLKTAMSTNLVLEVRRDNVLRDALNQLWRREKRELMRPLKVRMGMDEGEEGVDHGGVQQEFFRVAIGEALNPDYAIYNGLTLPLTFPKALYRKLLGLPVTELSHIRDGWPDLSRGLSNLLSWTDGHVEDVFMRSYEFVIEIPGSTLSVNMEEVGKEDIWPKIRSTRSRTRAKSASFLNDQGENLPPDSTLSVSPNPSKSNNEYVALEGPDLLQEQADFEQHSAQDPQRPRTHSTTTEASLVNNANREQYVKDYIFWLTDKSMRPQYEAFARGFFTCLDRKALSIFNPEALQSVVEGIQEIDSDALEHTTRYDDGYSAGHRVIRDFWHVVSQYSPEKKRQLLEFVTASDRVPVNGISTIQFVIQRNGTDDSASTFRVPTSLTCFGRLLLPEYSTRKKLKEKLKVAIENCRGFGVT